MPKEKSKKSSEVVSVLFDGQEAEFIRDEADRLSKQTGLRLSLRQTAMKIMRDARGRAGRARSA